MNGNLFTPRMGVTSNERYKLQISDEDQVKIMRGRTWEAIVTDIETGVHYRARGAECSASPECFCDAIAEPVGPEPEVDVYYTTVGLGFDYDDEIDANTVEDLRASAERALVLMKLDGVVLENIGYDQGVNLLSFTTTDAHLAERHDFDEVLRVGGEDFEPAPWTAVTMDDAEVTAVQT